MKIKLIKSIRVIIPFLIISIIAIYIFLYRNNKPNCTCFSRSDGSGGFITEKHCYFPTSNGYRSIWYKNEKIENISNYSTDSVLHGADIFFYPNGNIKDSAIYVNGEIHGDRFEYFENNMINYISTYLSGKMRKSIEFDSNGAIKYYRGFNYAEDLMFIIKYDSLGDIIRTDGTPIYSIVKNNEYIIGKKFSQEILVASPPNSLVKVYIYDYDIKTRNKKLLFTCSPDEYNRVVYNREKYSFKDTYTLHIANIVDSINKSSIIDTLFIRISEKGCFKHYRNLLSLNTP